MGTAASFQGPAAVLLGISPSLDQAETGLELEA